MDLLWTDRHLGLSKAGNRQRSNTMGAPRVPSLAQSSQWPLELCALVSHFHRWGNQAEGSWSPLVPAGKAHFIVLLWASPVPAKQMLDACLSRSWASSAPLGAELGARVLSFGRTVWFISRATRCLSDQNNLPVCSQSPNSWSFWCSWKFK